MTRRGRLVRHSRRFTVTAIIAALAVAITTFASPTAMAAPIVIDPPPADITAVATLTKTASVEQVAPGETFTYTLAVGCSAITDLGCRGAVLNDVVPAPFVLIDAVVGVGVNSAAPPVIAGNSVTVTWTTPLGDGTVGILDASTGIVEITAQLPADASHDVSGTPVTNNATIEGSNFADVDDSVPVTPVVPLDLATTATKAFSPSEAIATPGAPVSAALGATNTSNGTVDSLSIQDPVDPDAAPNPFDSLAFAGFGTVTPPTGADPALTTYEVYVDGAWVDAPGGTLPAGVSPDEVKGTRVTFNGAIPEGATGSVALDLTVTDAAASETDGTVVPNTVQSAVALDGDTATGDAAANFTLRQNAVSVTASKSFAPDLVIAGEPTTVTVGGTNASTIPIESLTITEPSTGEFSPAYEFGGFSGPVAWPAGATSGTVEYHLADGSTVPVTFGDNTTPALPPGVDASDVVSFDLVFTGAIVPGGSTSAPFEVTTDDSLTPLPQTITNTVGVEGENAGATGSATASNDLFIYDERIEPYISKQIRPPGPIPAVPGQIVTVTLNGGLTDRPTPPDTTTGTTGRADQVVIQDPEDPVEGDPWWNAFDLTAITQTPVPADSTLTIEYYDTTTGTWETLAGPIAGPAIYSQQVPPDISEVAGGVRFSYDYTGDDGGFAPGTDFAPSFSSSLRSEGRYVPGPPYSADTNTLIPDCAQTDASSPTPGVPDGQAVLPAADCPEIELIPADPGNADIIDKTFGTSSSGGVKSVIARSGDTIPSTLMWSTGGYSSLQRVEITDVATPETTPLADSMYNAFDLFRIEAITPANDPLIAYDAVQAVELYNGTTWVPATNNPCNPLCEGQFPGMALTADERASTTGVRLTFVEYAAGRTGDDVPVTAPPVGSGVARSFSNDRPVTLTWQVRDTRRTDGTPVLGDEAYNLAANGVVRNTVNASGFPADGSEPLSADDQDDVIIIDVPLTTTTDKNWAGGPLAAPTDPSIPAGQFPLSRITVTTRNTTPAKVDTLEITDTAPGSVTTRNQDPFQAFTFNNFARIDVPSGATSTTVTLSCFGAGPVSLTRDQALALTPATMPCDVSGVQVTYTGRIASNAAGLVSFDMRLRAYWRGTTDRVSPADSPISNAAQGIVADVDPFVACPPPAGARWACDADSANITIEEPSFSITADKTISPAEQKEDDFSPVTVTLTTQPGGSARAYTATMTDDDPTFWNAMEFVGMDPSWTLPAPLSKVQVCYLDGGTFTDASVASGRAAVGGDWTCMPRLGDLSIDAAKAFIAAAPPTLHGLSFQFWTSAELGWLNPVNPIVNVPFQVQRRVDLRTGEPTPTTRSDQVAAPGEQDPGAFFDTLEVHGISAEVGQGTRLTDDATDEAEYRNLHLQASVSVTKSPTGDVRPGVEIPFTLSYTNTGERALTDVVFTDELPLDANGNPQLIFYPDRDPSTLPWSFALTGAAPNPPNGDPLPVDPDVVDVQNLRTRIIFTMPDGAVLEPGQTYTITLRMMLRPGLTPADFVTNTATIDVAEPLDECVPSYDAATGLCADAATVHPLAVPALSTVKLVRADRPPGLPGIPDVRSDTTGFGCAGTADADGFYRYPCVPMTTPGDTETWRMRVTNAGTLPISRLVAIDNLPTPGDQGLIVVIPRGSQWRPTFAGGISLSFDSGAAAQAVPAVLYSTSSTPCTADLNPVGTPCAPGAWLPYTAAVDPTSVRSLKFQVDFPGAEKFLPGDAMTIEFKTTTTPATSLSVAQPTAYNTVSMGGSALNGATTVAVPATEGRRVGVAYPTGPVSLQKVVSGPGMAYAPDSFPVQLACTSAGNDLTGLPQVVLVPGADPTVVQGLPWGAECTATEQDNGQTSQIIGTTTVGTPSDPIGLVSIENVFEIGSLDISKTVESDAVDAAGDAIAYDPFGFEVDCTFLGDPVYADGYGPDDPMANTISDGDDWMLTGLPIGAECTVDESDAGAATSTQITTTVDGANPVVTDGTSADVTIGGGADSVTLAAFSNVVTVGAIDITKVVTGEGAGDWGGAEFEVAMTCTLPGADPDTVFDDTHTLSQADPVWSIQNLPTGAECTVSEPQSGGANSSGVISPANPIIVGTPADGPTAVTVTNTFTEGSVTVSKELQGEPAASLDPALDGSYTVLLACMRVVNGVTEPVVVPGGASRTITGAGSTTYTGLPTGAECSLTETDSDPVAQNVTVDPSGPFTVGDGSTPVAVTVTNEFTDGSIAVSKLVTGEGASFAPDSFTATVTCTWNGADVPLPDGGAVVLDGNGDPVVIDDIPTGSVCQAVETGDSGATTVTNPDPVTIAEGETGALQIVNDYELTGFAVTKEVDNGGAVDQNGDPIAYSTVFSFEASCTYLGAEVLPSADQQFDLVGGGEKVFTGLPVGADCTVTETATGGATSVSVNGDDTDTFDFTLLPGADAQVTVAFVNHFTVGSIQITKNVTGAGAEEWGTGQFEIQLVCTFAAAVADPVYSATHELSVADPVWTVDDLPTGSECAVSELDNAGATESSIDPPDGLVTIGTSGTEGGLALVTVTNDFRVGGLNVRKLVIGPGAPTFGTGPFDFAVSCTYEGENVHRSILTVSGDGTRGPLISDTIEGLPVGAECTVVEVVDGHADEAAPPVTVTIPDEDENGVAQVVTAGFVNRFSAAGITLTKQVDGAGADAPYATSAVFTVLVTCQFQPLVGGRVTLLSRSYQITAGETITLTDARGNPVRMPLGSRCFGNETNAGAATRAVVNPSTYDDGLVVNPNSELQTLALVATNTFALGSLQLSKVVTGTGAAENSSKTFTFKVTCVLDQGQDEPTMIIDGELVTITGGQTVTIDDLPVGAECWVAETHTGGATAVEISNSTAAMPAVVTAEGDAVITVTNTFTAPLAPTGADATPILIAGGVGTLLILGGVVLLVRRRRRFE